MRIFLGTGQNFLSKARPKSLIDTHYKTICGSVRSEGSFCKVPVGHCGSAIGIIITNCFMLNIMY